MLKKWISVSIACICAMVSFAIPSVAAGVEVTVDGFSVSVTAQTVNRGNQALKCYFVSKDGALSEHPVYMGQSEGKPTPCEIVIGEADNAEIITEYIHVFAPFTMDADALSGTYRVFVGDRIQSDFSFVNKKDKIDVYRNIANADSASIGNLLKTSAEMGFIAVDTKTYFDYNAATSEKMDAALAELPLPDITENATDEEIKAFEITLASEIARLCQTAELFLAEANELDEVVKQGTALNLDLKFYDDKNLNLSREAICTRMEDTFPETFSEKDVQDAFSGAVLLAILDTADYGSVTKALTYYDGTCITLTSQSKKLSKTQKEDVSTELKKKASSIDNLTDLEKAYEDEVDKIFAPEEEEEKPVSRPTGGGGSGGGGGNTRPGATTGTLPSNQSAAQTKEPEKTSVQFTDMESAPWAKEAVSYLAEKGILAGYGDNTFAPNNLVTREEFVKMITEALGIVDPDASCDFEDVAADRWSCPYIASGVNAGLIFGVSENAFAPTETITRQDMAVIVYRGANLIKLELTDQAFFADSDQIASYAENAVAKLAGAGIVSGMGNGIFAPNGTVTRAQAAQIIYKLLMANGGIG